MGPSSSCGCISRPRSSGPGLNHGTVEEFEHAGMHSRLKVDGEWRETRALIIASGASPRYLGIDREKELIGHGLTSCATCDGAFTATCPFASWEAGIPLARGNFPTRLPQRSTSSIAEGLCAPQRSWPIACWQTQRSSPFGTPSSPDYLTDASGEVRGVKLKIRYRVPRPSSRSNVSSVAIGHEPNTAFRRQARNGRKRLSDPDETGTHTNLPGVFARQATSPTTSIVRPLHAAGEDAPQRLMPSAGWRRQGRLPRLDCGPLRSGRQQKPRVDRYQLHRPLGCFIG